MSFQQLRLVCCEKFKCIKVALDFNVNYNITYISFNRVIYSMMYQCIFKYVLLFFGVQYDPSPHSSLSSSLLWISCLWPRRRWKVWILVIARERAMWKMWPTEKIRPGRTAAEIAHARWVWWMSWLCDGRCSSVVWWRNRSPALPVSRKHNSSDVWLVCWVCLALMTVHYSWHRISVTPPPLISPFI